MLSLRSSPLPLNPLNPSLTLFPWSRTPNAKKFLDNNIDRVCLFVSDLRVFKEGTKEGINVIGFIYRYDYFVVIAIGL